MDTFDKFDRYESRFLVQVVALCRDEADFKRIISKIENELREVVWGEKKVILQFKDVNLEPKAGGDE